MHRGSSTAGTVTWAATALVSGALLVAPCFGQDVGGEPRVLIARVENGLQPRDVERGAAGRSFPLAERMKVHGVPGLSLAVIAGGRIAWTRGYGVMEREGGRPVTPGTLFLAGSVSKPVSATAALRLVQDGRLDLDQDVNQRLASWKVPASEARGAEPVTLRRLLTHTAGLTVHGFPGYDRSAPVPSIAQILNGEKPANTPAVVVDLVPGTRWRYSGGGYTVMQLLLQEVSGEPFERLLHDTVLAPLGMTASTFENPLPEVRRGLAASGYYGNGAAIHGGWHVYPEMAAAGLWSTASDLARWAIGIQRSLAGEEGALLSSETAGAMLTPHLGGWGLGPALSGEGESLRFGHGGRDEGFDARVLAYARQGLGVAILLNANNDSGLVTELIDSVARAYEWPGFPLHEQREYVTLPVAELAQYRGSYDVAEEQSDLRVYVWRDGLWMSPARGARIELLAAAPDRFFPRGDDGSFVFERDGEGTVVRLRYDAFGRQGVALRR